MMSAAVCALLSGALFYLSYGVDNCWPLAWIAPVPLLWLVYGATSRWRIVAAAFFVSAVGMVYLFQVYGTYLLVGGSITLVVNGLLLSLALLMSRSAWRKLPSYIAILAFPAFWTSFEYLEGLVSPNGAWGGDGVYAS